MNAISARLTRCICDVIGEAGVSADFDAAMGLDSLDQIEVAMAIEDEFEVRVDDADALSCVSFADWLALVQKLIDGTRK